MAAPAVTVVLPTRDRRRLVARSLATVLAQVDVELEVVVVDDGSRDDTAEWVRSLADERVRLVVNPESRGVASARNRGIEEARSPWLAFLDDDDLWAPDKLAAQIRLLETEPSAGWACVGQVTLNGALEIISAASPPLTLDRPLAGLLATNAIPGGGSGVLASAELVREVGGFDPQLSLLADWDLWIRLGQSSPAAGIDRPLLGYVRHDANMSLDVTSIGHEFALLEAKYSELREQLGIWPDAEIWQTWIADARRRSGKRLAAIRADLRAVHRERTSKALVRAAVTVVSPRLCTVWRDRRTARQIPRWWVEQAESWLAPIRRDWLEPTRA
jgi:glycosyltransferase involved in cell wall biosynthesis